MNRHFIEICVFRNEVIVVYLSLRDRIYFKCERNSSALNSDFFLFVLFWGVFETKMALYSIDNFKSRYS